MTEWTECDEVAQSLLAGVPHDVGTCNAVNAWVNACMPDETDTIRSNVASSLWQMLQP